MAVQGVDVYSRGVRAPKPLADIDGRPARARPPLLATDPWFVALKQVCIYQQRAHACINAPADQRRVAGSHTPDNCTTLMWLCHAVQTLASPPTSAYLANYPLAGSQQPELDSGQVLSRGPSAPDAPAPNIDAVDAGSSTSAASVAASGSGESAGGLATGAIIGIVIGVAALAVAAIAAIVIARMKSKRDVEVQGDQKVCLLRAACCALCSVHEHGLMS